MRLPGTLVWSDLKMSVRNRQNLAFSFLLPVLLMVLLGVAFGSGPPYKVHIGVVDRDRSAVTAKVITALHELRGFKIHQGSQRDELAALRAGDRAAVVVFPSGFQLGVVGMQTSIVLYEDSSDPTNSRVALTAVRDVLTGVREASGQEQDIGLDRRPMTGRPTSYLDFMAPGILGTAVMFLGVQGSLATLVVHRESGLLRRLRVTPLRRSTFIASHVVVRVVLSVVQAVVLIGIAVGAFHVHVAGSALALAAVTVVGSASFTAVGMIASSAADSFESAITVGLVIIMPMVFLCGVFYPIDSLPRLIQPVVSVLPLTYLNDALRRVMNKGATLAEVRRQLAVLAALGAASFLVSLKAFRWE